MMSNLKPGTETVSLIVSGCKEAQWARILCACWRGAIPRPVLDGPSWSSEPKSGSGLVSIGARDTARSLRGKSAARPFNLSNLPALCLLSVPQLLARDRRALAQGAQFGPGDLRVDAAP